jgi:hypothetical protein
VSKVYRGRFAPTPPPPFSGVKKDDRSWDWPWNAPVEAVSPKREPDEAETPLLSPLASWIDVHSKEKRKKKARTINDARRNLPASERRRLEKRDFLLECIEENELNREALIDLNRESYRAASANADAETLAAFALLPKHIRQPLSARLSVFRRQQSEAISEGRKARPATKFIRGTIKRIIPRVEKVNDHHQTAGFRFVAARERLDELFRLPELSKREVQLVATLTAGAMETIFNRECDRHFSNGITPAASLLVYLTVAREALRLNITPPCWAALNPAGRRRGVIPYDLLPGALSRLCCATWWKRKLWHYRCEWREEQLRAATLVSRTTSAYVSHDALAHHREQRRRTQEFLRSHELVNDEGFTIDLESIYYAGISNPRHRRTEMMVTVKGMQDIAESRGDQAFWYTITCPSKYHANLESGADNPKWQGSSIRASSDYLIGVFASIRKKLNRKGLRWYGVRVAEPHHDGTVHGHVMVFCRPEDQEAITAILQEFAIREDRAELGNDITPRFKVDHITKEKGSPLAYIAAYIGKNIDGSTLQKPDPKTGEPPVSHDSGKSMAETVEHAIAWASLHRVRQFQFFGIPSRQAYRELRRLAGQLTRQGKDGKKTQRLADKAMDDVMSAADAGCIATYITTQGGILTPRSDHVVRTAYIEADKPNDYGEHGTQVYGVWSPRLGNESRICTHVDNWQRVKKSISADGGAGRQSSDVDLQGGTAAPWTRGNNCPPEQKTDKGSGGQPDETLDFSSMTRHQRHALMKKIRDEARPPPKREPLSEIIARDSTGTPRERQLIDAFAAAAGLKLEPWEINALLSGAVLDIGGGEAVRMQNNRIEPVSAARSPFW